MPSSVEISAELRQLRYAPLLCSPLPTYPFSRLSEALQRESAFYLHLEGCNKIAVSRWVSPKRTRSYPYARVYDTLGFQGRRVTVIPVVKDEGEAGDRDFVQFDTFSLMSLLQVYVILSYYDDASPNPRYPRKKITAQTFNVAHVQNELEKLMSFQSDALHWNLAQIDRTSSVLNLALQAYEEISKRLGIRMHSPDTAQARLRRLQEDALSFKESSRELAQRAQVREVVTRQPKEYVVGSKARIAILNYLGGKYYFTCDEFFEDGKNLYLVEAKHARSGLFPSEDDIKDGLIKMALFCNLTNVQKSGVRYKPKAILRLTGKGAFVEKNLSQQERNLWDALNREARENGFSVEHKRAKP